MNRSLKMCSLVIRNIKLQQLQGTVSNLLERLKSSVLEDADGERGMLIKEYQVIVRLEE